MRQKIFLLLLISISSIALGQKISKYDTSNSGIPNNSLTSISVDKKGNKWISSYESDFIKYDDVNFISINKNDKNKDSYRIGKNFIDSKDSLWFTTSLRKKPSTKLIRFNKAFKDFSSLQEINLSKISVRVIKESENGDLYLGGNWLYKYKDEKLFKVKLPSLVLISIGDIAIGENGDLAVAHNSGLLIRKNKKWNNYNIQNSEMISSSVNAVKYINGKLYIGNGHDYSGKSGFSIFENGKWSHFNNTNSTLPDNGINNIEIDRNGIIWMASAHHIIKIENEKIKPIKLESKYPVYITDFSIENDIIWVTTTQGLFKIE